MFARDYALVQVAIHDALVAAYDPRRDKLPDRVVAAGAASRVLAYLFPGDAGPIQTLAEAELTLVSAPAGHVRRAWGLGRSVGRLAVEHGTRDGSDAVFTGTPPSGEGIWTGTNPVLPMCGTWKTWLITSGSEFAPEPPYAFGSPQDLRDMQEVYEISLHRTPEQIAIVHKWADLPPPTIWNGVLNDRILGSGMSACEAARASAFLNAAMTEAGLAGIGRITLSRRERMAFVELRGSHGCSQGEEGAAGGPPVPPPGRPPRAGPGRCARG